jgi:hypothetical protein
MHRCFDVSRMQNFVCNNQTHISNYAGKLMRRLVGLVDQTGTQVLHASLSSNSMWDVVYESRRSHQCGVSIYEETTTFIAYV